MKGLYSLRLSREWETEKSEKLFQTEEDCGTYQINATCFRLDLDPERKKDIDVMFGTFKYLWVV